MVRHRALKTGAIFTSSKRYRYLMVGWYYSTPSRPMGALTAKAGEPGKDSGHPISSLLPLAGQMVSILVSPLEVGYHLVVAVV